MLSQDEWAGSVIAMSCHKLLETLEELNKAEGGWTYSEVEKAEKAIKALHYLMCVKSAESSRK